MRPKNLMKSAALVTLLAAFAVLVLPGSAKAQTFVYTNDNQAGASTVTAFSVGANGALTTIGTFPTGGTGSGDGFFASNRITVCMVGAFLFVANDGSNNVSVFSINPSTGFLTLVGLPVLTGGFSGGEGISLGATPDNRFLFAASGGSSDIRVFSIAANGVLTAVGPLVPAGGIPDGIKVSPDGKFLSVALVIDNKVAMFSIGSGGTLTPVPGSPFPVKGSGFEAGLDINCASDFLFGGEANVGSTIVDVFSIASNGALTEISGSPFTGPGINSNNVLLSPDDRFLFVSNLNSNQVSVFSVAANGSLTLVSGSPFATGGTAPAGLATDAAGRFLFVANFNSDVTVFSIASNGSLSPVTGSPFPTGQAAFSGLLSLTAFPGKSCAANQILVDYFANANTPGAPDATVRIVNPGTTNDPASNGKEGAPLCALIYVFDANQQLSECCGCSLTPNALATLSVNGNLTANPLLGTKLSTGVIKIVSSASAFPCDPTKITATPTLRAWATHIQNKVGTAFPETEGESQAVALGAGEQADLAEDCTAAIELGSGHGVCNCPPVH